MDIQDVIKYVNETPNNTNPAVLKGMIEAIVESSESGEGDVTWAKVKFINVDTRTTYSVNGLTGIVDTGYFEIITGMPKVEVQDDTEVTVPLYKGKYAINPNLFENIDESFFPQVSGEVALDMENRIIVVTGDGTITCKGKYFE